MFWRNTPNSALVTFISCGFTVSFCKSPAFAGFNGFFGDSRGILGKYSIFVGVGNSYGISGSSWPSEYVGSWAIAGDIKLR